MNNPNILKMVEKLNKNIERFYGIDCSDDSEKEPHKEQLKTDWEQEQQHDWDHDRKQSFRE